jgi:hypothetical protein
MTKVILQVYPTLGDTTEMARRRPIGRNNEAYQNMLESLVEPRPQIGLAIGALPTSNITRIPRVWRFLPIR